jgi:hypothetical protein
MGFDLYTGIGLTVRSSLGPNNFRELNELENYLQAFGNLLTLGTIHLSPDTAAVRDFANSSITKHGALGNAVPVRVHSDESTALDAIANQPAGERTWALLNFRNLSAMHLDYSIRLNYSTVPNTNEITKWLARGLDTDYQRYITSGYLTLQSLVDEYAFGLASSAGEAIPCAGRPLF